MSLGLKSSVSSLQSSWIMDEAKYTNMFVLNRINTFFVRTAADKMHISKMSSQCWLKVKTHTCTCAGVRTHHMILISGKHVSQIVESKKSFTVSVTASATAKYTSQKMVKGEKKNTLPEWDWTGRWTSSVPCKLKCSVCRLKRGEEKMETKNFWWEAAV